MYGLLSNWMRSTRYPYRQVINVPLLCKRIHLRGYIRFPEVPFACAIAAGMPAVCKSLDLVSDRARCEEVIRQISSARSSIGRIWWSIRIARGSFPEVIKYPTKSLCCRMAQSNSKSTLGASIIRTRVWVVQSGHIRPLFPNARLRETGFHINHYRICLQ